MKAITPACAIAAALTANAHAANAIKPDATMLRFPDVSASHVAFVYANDIWIVPREGGQATPLATPTGAESAPRFSPDGSTIAFVANYDGDRDLYTLPIAGGPAHRVTHHPGNETLNDWTPKGDKLLFHTPGLAGNRRLDQLFTINASGGMYDKLPVPYGTFGAISPDGRTLAYTPYTRDSRTWKRYRGGWATDIWLYNLKTNAAEKITDWEGTDTQPMWHKKTLYYLSDASPNHRKNIWSYNTKSKQHAQLTSFTDYDCKYPAMGPGPNAKGEIVLQNGSQLHLINLANGKATPIEISIPGDRPNLRPEPIDASKHMGASSLSPTGKRLAVEARGDIWSLPATKGATRNLTRTSGVAERQPQWSPDAKWISYISDQTGEYELWVMPTDTSAQPRQLTTSTDRYRNNAGWSPDSKHLAYTDNAGNAYIVNLDSGATTTVATDEWGGAPSILWSHDSAWIALTLADANLNACVWLYELANGNLARASHPMFNTADLVFDREGDFLYAISDRNFSPTLSSLPNDTGIAYEDSQVILAFPLRQDVASPLLPESDEEDLDSDEDADEDADDDDTDENEDAGDDDEDAEEEEEEEVDPITIDLADFESRAILIPVDAGAIFNLNVTEDAKLIYVRRDNDESAVIIFDPTEDDPEEKTVAADIQGYSISADGSKIDIRKSGKHYITDAKADQKLEDAVPTNAMTVYIDPREEWTQIFNDAWRVMRDYFYDPNMHGIDWPAIREHYEPILADCATRDNVTYVIQEMISELNVGHAYYRPRPSDTGPSLSVGLLACDFTLDNGAYRIDNIVRGADWDADAKGPLSQPGVDVNNADYLLAVNGVPMDTSKDPWAAFIGLANQIVELTVSTNPTIDDEARKIVVKTLSSESTVRFHAWVESMRNYVDQNSDGQVGYIYVRDVVFGGMNDMYRQFFGQITKPALIIDDRWNAGGFVFLPGRLIEMLDRPRTAYWARRHGHDWRYPSDAHQGPKAMMINSLSASGGDLFPYLFKQAGLGPLVGTRTWGGLVGLSGNPGFIDGTSMSVPNFGFYETNGTWGIEGHGVDPDIDVIDDPSKMLNGRDPQLDAAIKYLLDELQRNPYAPPTRPNYPDRSGMGLPDADK